MFIFQGDLIAYQVDEEHFCLECAPETGVLIPLTMEDIEEEEILACDSCGIQIGKN